MIDTVMFHFCSNECDFYIIGRYLSTRSSSIVNFSLYIILTSVLNF